MLLLRSTRLAQLRLATPLPLASARWTSGSLPRNHWCRSPVSASSPQPLARIGAADFASQPSSSPQAERAVEPQPSVRDGTWPRFLSKEAIVAGPGFPRVLAAVPSFLVQISIGSVYAWSMWNFPLTHELGVVAAAASDWTLSTVVGVFSLTATSLGFTTFFLGPWAERAGPRYVAAASATCYGTALALSSAGCFTHCLPLIYLGYGIFGGMGWGLGYISPVSTLLRWFPDKKGLAGGLALTAFGGGGVVASPLISALQSHFARPPTFLGPAAGVPLTLDGGRQFAEVDGVLQEVVVATASELAQLSGSLGGLCEGVYVVGTGSTGAGMAFLSLSALYSCIMAMGAAGMRVPAPGWAPAGYSEASATAAAQGCQGYTYSQAMRTPQFFLLWTAVYGNACSGMAILSTAKTVCADVFSAMAPALVTGAFTANYVAALSSANAVGRFGWAVSSDYLGRRNTYKFFATGIPVLASIPLLTIPLGVDGSAGSAVYLFVGSTMFLVMNYGGLFSVLPAYIVDLFGQRNAGAIHGRQLTAWTAAALTGPNLLTSLRARSEGQAIEALTARVSDDRFLAAFGERKGDLQELVEAKTVTIARLMELQAPGTVDPTPHLYDTTCFSICGMLSIAALSNLALRPPPPAPQIAAEAVEAATAASLSTASEKPKSEGAGEEGEADAGSTKK